MPQYASGMRGVIKVLIYGCDTFLNTPVGGGGGGYTTYLYSSLSLYSLHKQRLSLKAQARARTKAIVIWYLNWVKTIFNAKWRYLKFLFQNTAAYNTVKSHFKPLGL